MDISDAQARIRANVVLAPDSAVSFRWMGPSRTSIVVHGHVADSRMIDKRTAEYTIELNMPSRTRDVLAHELLEMQRRKEVKAAEPLRLVEDDEELGGVTRRKAYRALVQFPVTVRAWKRGRWMTFEGEARDLSVGGMMLLLPEDVEEGADLELIFTLPSGGNVPDRQTTEVIEITPFGERRVKKAAPVRRQDEIKTRARVLKQLGNARSGAPLFGVGFVELPGYYNESLARWIHGHQLSQLRKTPGSARRTTGVTRFYRKERPAAQRRHIDAARTVLFRAVSERHFGPPTFARDRRELVAMPAHAHSPSIGSDDDVFGFGDAPAPKSAPVIQVKPRECYIVGDDDVFGLGVRQEAS